MKTNATTFIESFLKEYKPEQLSDLMINRRRGIIRVSEVQANTGGTEDGIVDFMLGIEICRDKESTIETCNLFARADKKFCLKGLAGKDRPKRHECDIPGCKYKYAKGKYDYETIIVAIEIKVTKNDFKSSHGHNFIGNLNYYCMPKELYKDVEDLIPVDIGVLEYNQGFIYEVKPSNFVKLSDKDMQVRTWCMLKASQKRRNI